MLRQWGNIEKVPAGAGTAAAVRKNSWEDCVGEGGGGDGEERLLWGFGGVFKGDGRLGSGGLP